jgi:hypothetical protein
VCDEVRYAGVVDGIVAAVGVRLLAVSLLLLLLWLVRCRRLACTEPGDERGAVVRRRGRGISVVTLRRVRVLNPGGNLGRVEGSGPAVSVSTASVVSISRGAMRNSRSSAFARVGGARGVFISKRRGFNPRACSISAVMMTHLGVTLAGRRRVRVGVLLGHGEIPVGRFF